MFKSLFVGWANVLFLSSLLLSVSATAEDWIYTVRSGDTLWGLCKKYTKVKSCWLKIGDYNGVKYPRTLAPGTQIRFPVGWLIDPPAPARVTYIRGGVTAVNGGSTPQSLKRGDQITIGTQLALAKDALVLIQFADQSVMTIEGGSIVRFDVLSKFADTGMVDTRVHLQKGSVYTKVPKRRTPASKFEVSTPSSVAAVRGTEFRVSGDKVVTRNEVFGGEVEVSNTQDKKDLLAGNGLLAKKDVPLPEVVPLLRAPEIAVGDENQNMPFTLDWSDVDGALEYKIDLAHDSNPQAIVFTKKIRKSDFQLQDLKESCYVVRVSAFDQSGFQGMPAKSHVCLHKKLRRVGPIVVTPSTENKFVISWPALERVSHYRVMFASDESFQQTIESTTTESNKLEIKRSSNTALYVKVQAENADTKLTSEDSEVVLVHSQDRDESIFGRILFVLVAVVAIL